MVTHPEIPAPTCMSCNRDLQSYPIWLGSIDPKLGVPDDVNCCASCWRRMTVYERIKVVIAVRDRQLGGAVQLVASMIEGAILEKRGLP
jgi:hypothetical protein